MSIAGKKPISFISNPFLLALLLTFPISYYISRYFPRYETSLVSKEPVHKKDGKTYIFDIDNDGYSEELLTFTDTKGHASVQIYKQDGRIDTLIDFNGALTYTGTRLVAGDFNKDNTREIYCFYIRNDSLLLSAISFGLCREQFITDRLISFLGNKLNVIDCNLIGFGLYDIDSDGYDELIFSVMAGFPIFPRNVFCYDIHDDDLIISPFTGATAGAAEIYDLDGDGKKELFLQTYAPSNMKGNQSAGLNDSSAWLIVLDHRMNFKFRPAGFKGYTTSVSATPFQRSGKEYIGAIIRRKTYPSQPIELCVFDNLGNPVSRKQVDNVPGEGNFEPVRAEFFKDYFTVIDNEGIVFQYDENLNLVKKIDHEFNIASLALFHIDADHDRICENLIYTRTGDLVISRQDFSYPVVLDLNGEPDCNVIDVKFPGEGQPQIFIQAGRSIYYLEYGKNPLFYWQFPMYFGLYLFFLLIIILVMYLQRKILKDKYDAEKRISELQLMMVKDQLDPHFIFNAMNTINSLVILKRPEEAQQRILGLSKLMRSLVESSGKISQSLGEEIEFTRNYLDFQQKRYGDLFTYTIDIEADVDLKIKIPRMVFQILAENSIKHGLIPKGNGGLIKINIRKEGSNILIIIEDNGIGREESRIKGTGGTGKGLSILEQNFEILNRYNSEKLKFEFEDLFLAHPGMTGTRVKITVPINLNYKIYER